MHAAPIIPTYVFSWNGIDARNAALLSALRQPWTKVTIVASEDGESAPGRLRIGAGAHYGGQFASAVQDYFRSGETCGCLMAVGDMVPLQGAHLAALNGWNTRRTVFPQDRYPFLYAPYVHGPGPENWRGNAQAPRWGLVAPAKVVDCSCWYLNHKALEIAAALPPIHYGYGIDHVLCGAIRRRGGAVTIDFGCHMVNPPGKGYAHDAAAKERTAWFEEVKRRDIAWHDDFRIA